MKYNDKQNEKKSAIKKPDLLHAFATNTVVMKSKTDKTGVPKPSLEDVEIAKRWEQEHQV